MRVEMSMAVYDQHYKVNVLLLLLLLFYYMIQMNMYSWNFNKK